MPSRESPRAIPVQRPATLSSQARLISLFRLLLVVLALGVCVLFVSGLRGANPGRLPLALGILVVAVACSAGAIAMWSAYIRHRWVLAFHLVFDLAWVGLVIYGTGGVASTGVILLFAVVLIGNLVLPGVAPFLLPTVAGLVLSLQAALYLGDNHPIPHEVAAARPDLVGTNRILGNLALQVGAIFVVDLLGQFLARRLREQQRYTGEVLDQLGEGVLAIDRSGIVVYVNAEAVRLLDLHRHGDSPLADLTDQPVERLLAGQALAPVLALVQGERVPALERFEGFAGRSLVLRVTGLVGANGRPLGRTLLIADETRLRILEENARRSEHLASLGEMAAGIAHEVRNPLTSLRGCAQEVADICAKLGNPDAAALAGIMVDESDRLGRIVGDFLSLSRLRDPKRAEVDLEPIIASIERMAQARRDLPPGIAMVFSVAPDCLPLDADADQVRQLLANLINNALDAVRATPQPRIECRVQMADESALNGAAVRITVSDNGIGIPAELQERIFTPFFSTKAQGTGLGLSLVNRIVRQHEGVLGLSSQPGQGTTITIDLPARTGTADFRRALGAQ